MTESRDVRSGRATTDVRRWIWVLAVVALAVGVYALRPAASSGPEAESSGAAGAAALPKLVDLGADKCIPCKMMAPILVDLKAQYTGKFEVEFIDVWKNEGAGEKYGIKVIPTQIFYAADGTELFRHEGFYAKEEILAKWRQLGVEL
jgi:thioredoxin 1